MSPLILQYSSERREYTFSEQLIPYYKLQWVSAGHFSEWKPSAVGRSPSSPATQQSSHGHHDEGRYILQSPCSDEAGAWSSLQPLWKNKSTKHSSHPLGFSLLLKNSCEINVTHLIKSFLWLWGHLTEVRATPCHWQHPAWKSGARQPCHKSYYQAWLSQRLKKMTSV